MKREINKKVKDKVKVSDYEKNYSEEKFFEKIKKFSKKAGIKIIYIALILFYSLPDLSLGDRAIVIGALGYFISPLDIIPDCIPVIGLLDDFSIMAWACKRIFNNMKSAGKNNERIINKAKEKLRNIFGDYDENEVDHIFD